MSRSKPGLLGLFILLALFVLPQIGSLTGIHGESALPYGSTNSLTALSSSSPDFSVVANPSTVNLTIATPALVNLTLTSLNGFQGRVALDTESFPGGGLLVFWTGTGRPISLTPGESAKATLVIDPQSGGLSRGERVIWVSAGASPCLNHIIAIPITVGPRPTSDFAISADPSSLTFPAGDYLHYSTINVSSINSFDGPISFQYLGGTLTPQNLTLRPGTTASAKISFSTSTTACNGIYSSIVIATGGIISHAVVITERVIDPTVSTIYFYPSGYCCRFQNSNFTTQVRLNLPTGQTINAFDVRINYTNPHTDLDRGAVQIVDINYTGGLLEQGIVVAECIDGRAISKAAGCLGDSQAQGQIHLSMILPGSQIAGPVDAPLLDFRFMVTGNGTSNFIFDRAVLTSSRSAPSNPNLREFSSLPVLEKMAAFSNLGVVAILDSQPSRPMGSPALRMNQPVIFSAAGSFSPNGPYFTIQSYSWNFGDGTGTNTTTGIVDHTYVSAGSYAVSLKVADDTGMTGELVRQILVSRDNGNLSLTVSDQFGVVPAGNVRVEIHNVTSPTSTGIASTLDQNGLVEFDNLTPGSYNATFEGSAVIASSTIETILPGWTTSGNVIVTVSVTPFVAITSVSQNADTMTQVFVNFTIFSSTTVTGILVDWGDGTVSRPSPTATSDTHTYLSTGNQKSRTFLIGVVAYNNAGSMSATVSESILDQPPTLTINSPFSTHATTNQTIAISFMASDPDGTISSLTVDWGDGSTLDTLPAQATSDTHGYSKTGSYTVSILATDNSGSTIQVSSQPIAVSLPLALPEQAVTILGLAPTEFYAAVASVLIFVAATTLLVIRRERHHFVQSLGQN